MSTKALPFLPYIWERYWADNAPVMARGPAEVEETCTPRNCGVTDVAPPGTVPAAEKSKLKVPCFSSYWA